MASASKTQAWLQQQCWALFVSWSHVREGMAIVTLQHNGKIVHVVITNILLPMWNLNLLQLVQWQFSQPAQTVREWEGESKAKQSQAKQAHSWIWKAPLLFLKQCPSRPLYKLLWQNCGFASFHLQGDFCWNFLIFCFWISAEDAGLSVFPGHCRTEGKLKFFWL